MRRCLVLAFFALSVIPAAAGIFGKFIAASGTLSLTFSGPSNGVVSTPSAAFTVMLVGTSFNGSQTVTVADGSKGGTFTPSVGSPGTSTVTVTPTNGSTSFTFTYTPAVTGNITLTLTNAQMWGNPAPVVYASTGSGSCNDPNGCAVAGYTDYYITTSGSDSNNGTSIATAWATPNHALNCSSLGGDYIHVQPGTYSNQQFGASPPNSGAPTTTPFGAAGTGCSGHGVFRTVQCAGTTLGACLIDNTGGGYWTVWITTPYWIFKGFQVTAPVGFDPCIAVGYNDGVQYAPVTSNGHDVLLINNWVHDCQRTGSAIGDYVAVIGQVNFNTAGQGTDSGIDIYEPDNFDTNSGTHIFVAGAFVIGTTITVSDTDGEGIIHDDWDCTQHNVCHQAYTGQGVIEQSMSIGNASNGVEVFNSRQSSHYLLSSTIYSNSQNTDTFGNALGEVVTSQNGTPLTADHIIAVATKATNTYCNNSGCSPAGHTTFNYYALSTLCGGGTVTNSNYFNTASGSGGVGNVQSCGGWTDSGGNQANVNPSLASPAIPTSVNCSTYATTTACMSGLGIIGNFVAGNTSGSPAINTMGYQAPGACGTDPGNSSTYWPSWVPLAVIPAGIVTTPCPPGAPVVTAGATVNYTVGQAAVVLDSTLSIVQGTSPTLSSATVQITASALTGNDTLACPGCTGAISASYNASAGGGPLLTITASPAQPIAAMQTALQSVTFKTTSATNQTRTITWQVTE